MKKTISVMRSLSSFLFFLLMLFVFAFPAWSQTQELYRKEVLQLYKQGRELAVQKKYGSALLKFQSARALFKQMIDSSKDEKQRASFRQRQANLLYIIAKTHQLNKQDVVAYKTYQESMASNPPKKLLVLLHKQMSELFPKVATTVLVKTMPSKASVVLVDSNQKTHQGTTPFTAKLPPGKVLLTLRADKFQTMTKTLSLSAKVNVEKEFSLKAVVVPKPRIVRRKESPKLSSNGRNSRRGDDDTRNSRRSRNRMGDGVRLQGKAGDEYLAARSLRNAGMGITIAGLVIGGASLASLFIGTAVGGLSGLGVGGIVAVVGMPTMLVGVLVGAPMWGVGNSRMNYAQRGGQYSERRRTPRRLMTPLPSGNHSTLFVAE